MEEKDGGVCRQPFEFVKSSLVCFDPCYVFRCGGDGRLIIYMFTQKSWQLQAILVLYATGG